MATATDPALLDAVRARPWFYEFDLPDGTRTVPDLPPGVEKVHTTRRTMLDAALDARFGAGLSSLDAVDLACHQGWFSMHLAARGVRSVLGVDARASHLEDAALMARVLGVQGFETRLADLEDARAGDFGTYDITLMMGLLYHLENPVRVLRLARAITRKTLFVESQVVPHMSGVVDWGGYMYQRHLVGTFGVVDETGEGHGPQTGVHGICLAPSIETLAWLLGRVGFARVERLVPPRDGYEQLVGQKRVMFAAHVE
jgi:tRNA (mo5U34)-methyltransferase